MMIRTFIALEIPVELKKEIALIINSCYGNDIKVHWEKKDKLHLTLKFLGDTDQKLIVEISKGIAEILKNQNPLGIVLNGFGIFRKENKPKILWAGFEENKELAELAGKIDELCDQFGFEKENRKFKLHLTILRIKGFEDFDKLYSITKLKITPKNFSCNEVTFYKSELKPDGSEYMPLKKFYLIKEN